VHPAPLLLACALPLSREYGVRGSILIGKLGTIMADGENANDAAVSHLIASHQSRTCELIREVTTYGCAPDKRFRPRTALPRCGRTTRSLGGLQHLLQLNLAFASKKLPSSLRTDDALHGGRVFAGMGLSLMNEAG
jgi:hypothetical protein